MRIAEHVRWKDSDATRISNDLIELTALTHGGHLAEFRFSDHSGFSSQNVLWESPWMGTASVADSEHGVSQTGGFTGHALCLPYFGPPSSAEAAAGLPIHGEAASMRWHVQRVRSSDADCRWEVQLPHSQLQFSRTMNLRDYESVVLIEEIVRNRQDKDYECQCVQHATFSPPFVTAGDSTLLASATRGITAPSDYEGGTLITVDQEFSWPYAPAHCSREATVDLRLPFSAKGYGCLAGVQMDPQRNLQFVLAINWKLRLGVGYCFRRRDFPWMAIWEENCARPDHPWNGTTQARGMEFGTTPLPLGREEMSRRGEIFDTPTRWIIPAHGQKTTRYAMFLFTIPTSVPSIQDVEVRDNYIVLHADQTGSLFMVPAYGCRDFLMQNAI